MRRPGRGGNVRFTLRIGSAAVPASDMFPRDTGNRKQYVARCDRLYVDEVQPASYVQVDRSAKKKRARDTTATTSASRHASSLLLNLDSSSSNEQLI